MSGRTPGAERLYRARRAAAKELGVKANDPRAIRLATLQCAHDSAQAQLAGGRTIDIDSLLKLDAALAQARAVATSAPSLNVQFCRRLYGVCCAATSKSWMRSCRRCPSRRGRSQTPSLTRPSRPRAQYRQVRSEYKPRFPHGRSDQKRGLRAVRFRIIPRCLLASLSEE